MKNRLADATAELVVQVSRLPEAGLRKVVDEAERLAQTIAHDRGLDDSERAALACVAEQVGSRFPRELEGALTTFNGRLLRQKREAQRLTQAAVSAKSGISTRQLQRLEKNESEPEANTIRALAGTLGCSPSELCDAPTSYVRPLQFAQDDVLDLERIARTVAHSAAGATMAYYRSALAKPSYPDSDGAPAQWEVAATVQMLRTLVPLIEEFTVSRRKRWCVYAEQLSDSIGGREAVERALQQMKIDRFSVACNGTDFAAQLDECVCVLINAIDGTANFRMGLPLFCTSVAVFDGREPRVGALYDPNQNVLFCGATSEDEGRTVAYIWDVARGRRVDPATVFPVDDLRVLATHMPSKARDRALDVLRRLAEANYDATDSPLFHRFAMLNSDQLALTYVASRSVTAFVNVRIPIWNVAAGEAIIRSLGGRVTDGKGSRIEYGGSEVVSVVASSSDVVHDAIIEVLDDGGDMTVT